MFSVTGIYVEEISKKIRKEKEKEKNNKRKPTTEPTTEPKIKKLKRKSQPIKPKPIQKEIRSKDEVSLLNNLNAVTFSTFNSIPILNDYYAKNLLGSLPFDPIPLLDGEIVKLTCVKKLVGDYHFLGPENIVLSNKNLIKLIVYLILLSDHHKKFYKTKLKLQLSNELKNSLWKDPKTALGVYMKTTIWLYNYN
jgi:hypothetical protein